MDNNQFRPFPNDKVPAALEMFPAAERDALLKLRELIFKVASEMPEVGQVEESLKWEQPSYVTKVGTPIRLGVAKDGGFAVFTHCQSRVIPEFKSLFPDDFRYDGTRGVLFGPSDTVDYSKLRMLIRNALGYRLSQSQS